MKRIKKRELLLKSREAMLAAVQIYNNPQVTFKSESFITLAIVAWTYLLHTYYANNNVEYRYYSEKNGRKYYDRTKHGAFKHWELERCLNCKDSPIDSNTANNLRFLIGIRHEIEHQMTKRIDDSISAKIQACSINYNYYIKKLFGAELGVDQDLGLSIQFSPLVEEQKALLLHNEQVASNVKNYITAFEDSLSSDEINNTHYAYRVVFARVDGKKKNSSTDEVITFIPENDPRAKGLNTQYTLIKETEKKKYPAKEIIQKMHEKGYTWMNTSIMTAFWKKELGKRDQYGVYVTPSQWMWYENWLPIIETFCAKEDQKIKEYKDVTYKPNEIVQIIHQKGYKEFSIWWIGEILRIKGISKDDPMYSTKDRYGHTLWKKEVLPIIEQYCESNRERFVYGRR